MPKKAVELEETSKFGHFCTSIVRDTSLLFFSNSFGYYTSYYDLDTFSHSSKSLSLSPSHSLSRKYKSIFLCMKMYRVTYFYPLKQITIIFYSGRNRINPLISCYSFISSNIRDAVSCHRRRIVLKKKTSPSKTSLAFIPVT